MVFHKYFHTKRFIFRGVCCYQVSAKWATLRCARSGDCWLVSCCHV